MFRENSPAAPVPALEDIRLTGPLVPSRGAAPQP